MLYSRSLLVILLLSLVAQMVKSLPAMQKTWVRSLGWEDPLEKKMATHSIILAWKIPRTKEPGRLQSMGSQRVRNNWATNAFTLLLSVSHSVMANPMDCSPPDSSVHEIFQARILEWVAISFSRGSSQPRDRTRVSCTAGRFFTDWATREAPRRGLAPSKCWINVQFYYRASRFY